MKFWNSPKSACIEGQTSVNVWKQSAQTRLHSTPQHSLASLIRTYRAEGPSEVESRGPGLAWLAHSFRSLILNEPLTTKGSKGFSKKCNFHLGSKVLPKGNTAITTSPFHPFSTLKGKGDKRRTALNLWTKLRAAMCCSSPFTALKYPLTCPVSYQSAASGGAWRGQEPGCHRSTGTRALREDPAPIFNRTHLS